MSIYKNPLDNIFETINRDNKINLVQNEYFISAPRPIAVTTWGANTEMDLTSKSLQSAYSGSITIKFRRLPLVDLKVQGKLLIPAHELTTTRDVYLLLNRYYGTKFTDDDIVVRDLLPDEMIIPGVVTLTANANSYGWTGSVEVPTRIGGYELSKEVKVTKLPGFDYPGSRVNRPFGHIYSFWRDFTGEYSTLQDVVLGDAPDNLEKVRAALQAVTGDAWVTEGRVRFSLEGATVTEIDTPASIGPEYAGDFNPRYEHAIRVVLDSNFSLGLEGYLVLHYNTPFDMG